MAVIEVPLTDQEALRLHPELAELVTIRQARWQIRNAGWQFMHRFDGYRQVAQVDGYYRWPGGWMDAIGIRASTDAVGIRMNGANPPDILWQHAGTLTEVVAELLVLPVRESPATPRLVIAPVGGLRDHGPPPGGGRRKRHLSVVH